MATQLQLRKGNTAQTVIFTGAVAEVTVDTDLNTITVHDGVTAGGHYIARQNDLQSAYNQANTGTTLAQAAFDSGNTTITFAQASFDKANADNILAQFSYDTANLAYNQASSAYNTANVGYNFVTTGGTVNGGVTVNSLNSNTGITIGTILTGNLFCNTYTTVDTTQVMVDTFPITTYRTADYQICLTSGSDYHTAQITVLHNGTNVWLNQYGDVFTNASLGTFDSDISSGNLRLLFTPVNAATTVDFMRKSLSITGGGGDVVGDLMSQSGTVDLLSGSGTEDLMV